MTTSRPAQRTDAVRNRQLILDATRALVSHAGPGVSMEVIAAAAGVAVGTLYRHFPTKEALLQAVVEEKIAVLVSELTAAQARVAAGGSAWAELATMFLLLGHRQAEDRAVKAAVAQTQRTAGRSLEEDEQHALSLVEELVAAAHAEGTLRRDVDAADLGWLLQGLPGREVDEATRARCADVVLAGLRAAAR